MYHSLTAGPGWVDGLASPFVHNTLGDGPAAMASPATPLDQRLVSVCVCVCVCMCTTTKLYMQPFKLPE